MKSFPEGSIHSKSYVNKGRAEAGWASFRQKLSKNLSWGSPKSGPIKDVHSQEWTLQGEERELNPNQDTHVTLVTPLRSNSLFILQITACREVKGPRCCPQGRGGRPWATEPVCSVIPVLHRHRVIWETSQNQRESSSVFTVHVTQISPRTWEPVLCECRREGMQEGTALQRQRKDFATYFHLQVKCKEPLRKERAGFESGEFRTYIPHTFYLPKKFLWLKPQLEFFVSFSGGCDWVCLWGWWLIRSCGRGNTPAWTKLTWALGAQEVVLWGMKDGSLSSASPGLAE